jgi:hypothetical protein
MHGIRGVMFSQLRKHDKRSRVGEITAETLSTAKRTKCWQGAERIEPKRSGRLGAHWGLGRTR